MSLKEKTQTLFADAFGYPASHVIQAPGRVNLIGEHTDYNDGFVLPCAIDYQTVISCAPRDDRTVRVIAADYDNQTDEFSLDAPIISHDTQQWSNYVRGVVKHLQQRNSHFGGADLVISGNVPQGAGLSSSASLLEVAVGTVFQQLYHLPLDGAQIALNGRGGKPVRRLQLRHHGSADFSAGQKRPRAADRLPFAGHQSRLDAERRGGGDHQQQL